MITVRTTPGPFQWPLVIVSPIIGVTLLVAARASRSTLLRLMPPWVLLVLGLGMFCGGVIALAGMLSQTSGGLMAERVGLSWLCLLWMLYGVLAWYYVGSASVLQLELLTAFAVSCGWRTLQIRRQVRRLRGAVRTAAQHHDEGG